LLELADGGGGHGDASPAAAGPVEHGPDEAEAVTLAGEPADDLDPQVRSMKFEWRSRLWCSAGKPR
jgi:hypothetical protein